MSIYKDFVLSRGTLDNISEVTDEQAINNALKNIFSTPLGSLHGKPRFGTRLYEIVFTLMDYATELTMREIIREEIVKFEPRITLRELDIKNVQEYNKIVIHLKYTFNNKGIVSDGSAKITLV